MINGLVEINQQIHYLAVFALGIFALFVITTIIASVVWNIVNRWFRNGNGNRRSNRTDWPDTMVEKLTRIDLNIERVCESLSRNGLARASSVEEVKQILVDLRGKQHE